jgi:hypothetical protein
VWFSDPGLELAGESIGHAFCYKLKLRTGET